MRKEYAQVLLDHTDAFFITSARCMRTQDLAQVYYAIVAVNAHQLDAAINGLKYNQTVELPACTILYDPARRTEDREKELMLALCKAGVLPDRLNANDPATEIDKTTFMDLCAKAQYMWPAATHTCNLVVQYKKGSRGNILIACVSEEYHPTSATAFELAGLRDAVDGAVHSSNTPANSVDGWDLKTRVCKPYEYACMDMLHASNKQLENNTKPTTRT